MVKRLNGYGKHLATTSAGRACDATQLTRTRNDLLTRCSASCDAYTGRQSVNVSAIRRLYCRSDLFSDTSHTNRLSIGRSDGQCLGWKRKGSTVVWPTVGPCKRHISMSTVAKRRDSSVASANTCPLRLRLRRRRDAGRPAAAP